MEQTSTPYKILHLEPTDACNAACPQCAREFDTNFDKDDLHHLTIDQIEEILGEEAISGLDKMYMCGDYGDPAAGKHTLDIYRYFRHVNPGITLGMNSNGGIRTESWWRELGRMLSREKDYAIFSIDGLEDTNHIYRVNVKWSKVIENARAFIEAGGNAHWDMLVFEHNKHQVDECEELARQLGFKWFRAKVSRRNDVVPVEFLQHPKGWRDPVVSAGPIVCEALENQSRYISADGRMFPCCYLGSSEETIERFPLIQSSWSTEEPYKMCSDTCRHNGQGTSFDKQWQREVKLK